jgi:hypothetical protein
MFKDIFKILLNQKKFDLQGDLIAIKKSNFECVYM